MKQMKLEHSADDSAYKIYDFQNLWKYFPINRPLKEKLKHLMFTCFPFYFNDWAVFQNWRFAKAFFNTSLRIWHKAYWERLLLNEYRIPVDLHTNPQITDPANPTLAVVVHAFYPDIFHEILQKIDPARHTISMLYVTTTEPIEEDIKLVLSQYNLRYKIVIVKNHGRDILPFLKVLPQLIEDGHTFILKLHTKRSNHLSRKDHWKDDLFQKLIADNAIEEQVNKLQQFPSIGLLGPTGNILSMELYYGANAERVHRYSKAMSASESQIKDLNFVAGSMFYARVEALLPLLRLGLGDDDFEFENDQKDGTMAHVVERLFSVSTLLANLHLADSQSDESKPYYTVSTIHHFIR